MSSRPTHLRVVTRNDLTTGAREDDTARRGESAHDATSYPTFGWQPRSVVEITPVAQTARAVQILDLGSARLRLSQPLPVSLETHGDQVVARSYDLELFEEGETDGEALDSLKAAVVELFFALRELEDNSRSRYLTQKLRFLESICQCL